MQQKMMKYMMIFMGVMFFKVPSGLCLYFIASSTWGIAERKMLHPPQGTTEPRRRASRPRPTPSPSAGARQRPQRRHVRARSSKSKQRGRK